MGRKGSQNNEILKISGKEGGTEGPREEKRSSRETKKVVQILKWNCASKKRGPKNGKVHE
jgi:hypothetical protein